MVSWKHIAHINRLLSIHKTSHFLKATNLPLTAKLSQLAMPNTESATFAAGCFWYVAGQQILYFRLNANVKVFHV